MSTPQGQLSQVPDFDSYAASRGGVPDFDSYVASKKSIPPQRTPSRAAPSAAAPASVNPQLDSFVNDVMGEASRRTGYTYKLGSGVRTPEEQAQKVAQGYSRTYDSKHLSGSARDVLAFDSSGNYITDGQHPAYKALGDVYRERVSSSPVSVRWGGDFNGFYDPGHFELGEAAGQPSAQVPDFDEYVKAKSDVPDFDSYVAQKRGDADGPVVETDARPAVEPQTTLAPLPQRETPDVMTQEGRSMRDARKAVERMPGASLEVAVPMPADLNTPGGDLVRDAYRSAAASCGVPADFFDAWVKTNAPTGYSLRGADGKELTVASAMKPDAFDEKNHSLRVRLDAAHLSQIVDDYKLAQLRSVPGMESAKSLDEAPALLRDLTVDVDETSPGEKFLAGATPVAHAALRTADLATRPLQALDAGFWAKVRGARDPAAVMAAYQQFFGNQPELGKNVLAEALRNSDKLRAINPKLPGFLGELADILIEPSNVALIGGTALGAKLLRGSAAAGRVGEAARGLSLLDRGFVEARPLGLGDAALGSEASESAQPLHVLLRGTDGTNYLAHTGTGDVVNLETGELVYEGGKPVAGSGAVNSAELPGAGRPPLTESEIAQKAREVGMPVEEVRQEALRQGYQIAPDGAQPEQPLHEYLEELTGRPAPEIQPAPQPPPSLGARVVNVTSDIINAPKSIKSSIALHGPFRQGVFQVAAHPTFLQDAITQQVKAFVSEDAYRAFAQSLTEKPWYQPMQDAGLFLPSTYDVEMGGRAPAWLREERFASAAAEKIPGVRASSRAYVGAMDSIRSQAVEHYLTTLYGPEMDLSKADPETLRALARFVNISTGRGEVPILDRFDWGRKAVAAANNLLWSPRALAARANIVSPYRFIMNAANPATRPVAALQAADSMRAALTVGGTLSLLSLVPGVKVGLNPFKPGWGTIKVGSTEYDVLDGVPSTVKYAAQVGQALYRHAEGKPPVTRHGQEQTVYNLTKDFLRKRLSPSGQFAAEYLTGKNAMGERVSGAQMASDLLTPFTLEEMYKAWLDAGGSSVTDTLDGNKEFKTGFKGAVKGLPSAVGIPTRVDRQRGDGSNDAGPSGEVLDSRSPASSNYMALDGARQSANVEDRRAPAEAQSAGPPEATDAEAAEIGRFLDSLDDKQFSDFAKSLDETYQMGRAGEAADLAGEYTARGMSSLPIPNAPRYAEGAQLTRALRMLAREKRLRPAQFSADAAAGRYGDAMSEEMPERIYYPQNHFPRER